MGLGAQGIELGPLKVLATLEHVERRRAGARHVRQLEMPQRLVSLHVEKPDGRETEHERQTDEAEPEAEQVSDTSNDEEFYGLPLLRGALLGLLTATAPARIPSRPPVTNPR